MNKMRHIEYQYPLDEPRKHIFDIAPKKRRGKIDKDYPFVGKGFFYGLCAGIIRGLALIFLPVWAWLLVRPKIYGKKNLRALKKRGAVIAANHVHVTDASVICAMVSRARKVRFITLPQNIDLRAAGGALKMLGGIPIAEDYGGMKKFNEIVLSLLDRKKLVLVFPEVAMWPYYTGLRPFEKGAFFFAAKANAPVLPMVFTFKINKKGNKKRMILRILPAVEPDPSAPDPAAAQKDAVTARMTEAMDEFYANPKNVKYKEDKTKNVNSQKI